MAVRIYVFIVALAFPHLSKAALPTGCKTNTNACPDNSACDDGTDKCVCNDGFKLNTATDGCIQKAVLGDTCQTTSDCADVSNSKCVTTCVCDDAFKVSDGSCVAKAVLGDSCQTTSDCADVSNSKCDTNCVCDDAFKVSGGSCIAKVLGDSCKATSDCAAVSNSKCDTNCVCDDAFKVSDGSCVAKAVNEIPCTDKGDECESIDNALCDAGTDKCQCSPNFVMNVATCEPNTAASIRVGATTLVLSVFAAIWAIFR